ncbi:ABC transporter substrate-binding protein [Pseudonocardia pini]|uniref:ABC transporter substrate-binding protein n=1 Tax=Pseudonocardia pini TaxID=2758030 RepID=UPI0015F061C7|nr:ABC transporter substrate-binding protein [Pseudonocardia pini]
MNQTAPPPGRPSRRWMFGCLAVLTTVLAGCAGGGAQQEGSTAGSTFTQVEATLPQSLDPNAAIDAITTKVTGGFASPLVQQAGRPAEGDELAPATEVAPYLAESWEKQPNGGYLFRLRTDAVSQAGNPLTSRDVDWSLRRALEVGTAGSGYFTLGAIDTTTPVTVIDDHSFTLNVTRDNELVLASLVFPMMSILDSTEIQKHATPADPWGAEWLKTNSAGFGPYQVSSFTPAQSLRLTRNPNHWANPTFTDIVLRSVPDAGSRLQLVQSGEAQATSGLTWSQFGAAAETGSLKAEALPSNGAAAFYMQEAYAPFADVRVRQAVAHTVDMAQINQAIFGGYGTIPGANPWLPPAMPSPGTLPSYTRDLDRAKALMAEAGYAGGFDLEISATPGTSGDWAGDLIQILGQQLAEIGIRVTPNIVPSVSDFNARSDQKQLQATVSLGTYPVNSPTYAMRNWDVNQRRSPATLYSYRNDRFQELRAQMAGTAPGPALDAVVLQAATVVAQDVPMVNLVQVPAQLVTTSALSGVQAYTYPILYWEQLGDSS